MGVGMAAEDSFERTGDRIFLARVRVWPLNVSVGGRVESSDSLDLECSSSRGLSILIRRGGCLRSTSALRLWD